MEFTQLNGLRPNPEEILLQLVQRMAVAIDARLLAEFGDAKNYMDSRLGPVEAVLANAGDIEKLQGQIGQLQALLNSLDINGDGSLAELVGISTTVENLAGRLESAEVMMSDGASRLTQMSTDLGTLGERLAAVENRLGVSVETLASLAERIAVVDSNSAAIAALQERARTILATQQEHAGRLTAIEQQLVDGVGVSAEQVLAAQNDVEAKIYRVFRDAAQLAAMQFDELLADRSNSIFSQANSPADPTDSAQGGEAPL